MCHSIILQDTSIFNSLLSSCYHFIFNINFQLCAILSCIWQRYLDVNND